MASKTIRVSSTARRLGSFSSALAAIATISSIPEVRQAVLAGVEGAQKISIKRRKRRIKEIRRELFEERGIRFRRFIRKGIKRRVGSKPLRKGLLKIVRR